MKIVADENIPFVAECFSSVGEVITIGGRDVTPAIVKDADALLVRSITKVDSNLLSGSSIKFVGTATIGFEHIALDYLAENNIGFSSAPGSNSNSVAEYIISAVLNLADKYNFDISKKSLGIIGVGNVGSKVAQKASASDMKVVLNDPPLQRKTGDAKYRPLDEIFDCDIITVHTPLTRSGVDKTYHLADDNFFKSVKAGAVFINSSRGKVHDTAALKSALKSGHLQACVLDVWENEPNIDTALLDAVDFATPHIAGYSYDGKVSGMLMIYNALCQHFNIVPAKKIADFLPAPAIAEIAVEPAQKSPLLFAVNRLYDIKQDDANLRQLKEIQPQARAAFFDSLRKKYRIRREFQNTKVIVEDKKLKTVFKGLGFEII